MTDFGLAKRVEAGGSLTQSGAVLGTPAYMPPEQAAGKRGELSPASDVYSLGAILYQMLTGRAPFQAASPVDTLLAVLEQVPLPPRLLNPQVDPDLEMIALKCLQKPADLRYSNATELAGDLEAYLNGEPVSARSSGFLLFMTRALRETHHAAVLENWGSVDVAQRRPRRALHDHELAAVARGRVSGRFSRHLDRSIRSLGGHLHSPEKTIGAYHFRREAGHSRLGSEHSGQLVPVLPGDASRRPALSLSPILALIAAMVFFIKAGILTGMFYIQAAACLVTAFIMALVPQFGLIIFGLVTAVGFFVPGLKYHRQRLRSSGG